MTTTNQARERVYSQFLAGWGVLSPVTFDNEAYTPPSGARWVRLVMRHTVGLQETLGAPGLRRFERRGNVIVQCFVPLNAGVAAADELATAARTVFEGKTLGTEAVHFFGVSTREIGNDGAWYQINVEASFLYHETK